MSCSFIVKSRLQVWAPFFKWKHIALIAQSIRDIVDSLYMLYVNDLEYFYIKKKLISDLHTSIHLNAYPRMNEMYEK